MATPARKAAQRNAIELCVELKMTPTQTLNKLHSTEKYKSVSRALVFKWHKRFSDGWTEAELGTSGRPKEVSDTMVQSVSKIIKEDRRQTIRDIALRTGCGKSTIHRILHEELKMSRVCARWVPRLLSAEEKETRVRVSTHFLRRFTSDPNFLNKIITVDETWLHYYDPEDKRQSSVWKTADSPPPKKAKVTKSMGKHMFVVFIDRQGVLLCHAVPLGLTVNSAYYSKLIRRDLLHAIRKKRPALIDDMENIIFHQDNAPCHRSQQTQLELDVTGFQRLEHAPYSPDLAPLDFAVFPYLKSHLRGHRFENFHQLRQETLRVLGRLNNSWFESVYDKWVSRHRKCIEHSGEYFEKE